MYASMALKANINMANAAVSDILTKADELTKEEIVEQLRQVQLHVLADEAQAASFDTISPTPLFKSKRPRLAPSARPPPQPLPRAQPPPPPLPRPSQQPHLLSQRLAQAPPCAQPPPPQLPCP